MSLSHPALYGLYHATMDACVAVMMIAHSSCDAEPWLMNCMVAARHTLRTICQCNHTAGGE